MKKTTFYYIGKESRRMFVFPGAPVKTFKNGDTVEVPERYIDLIKKQKGDLFTDKSPSVKKEFRESESITKPFTGGETKTYSKSKRKKRE